VACNITGEDEFIKSQSVGQWRAEKIDLHKKPTIFLIYR
jgi:16S rRNA (cytidine1402-2'-O)-methyltransferase